MSRSGRDIRLLGWSVLGVVCLAGLGCRFRVYHDLQKQAQPRPVNGQATPVVQPVPGEQIQQSSYSPDRIQSGEAIRQPARGDGTVVPEIPRTPATSTDPVTGVSPYLGNPHVDAPPGDFPSASTPPNRFHEPYRATDSTPEDNVKNESASAPAPVSYADDDSRAHLQWPPPAGRTQVGQSSSFSQPMPAGPIGQTPMPGQGSDRGVLPLALMQPPVLEPVPSTVPEDRLPSREIPVLSPGRGTREASDFAVKSQAVPQRPKPQSGEAGGPHLRMVNSRRILLDCDLADVPKPESSLLELWYTLDGRNWVKDDTAVESGSPYIVEVNKEGTYGFMMVARMPGERSVPPTPGEPPQVWVEVDWSKPAVQLIDCRTNLGPTGRTLSLAWMASDNNLARTPITLSYAEAPEGPWKPFAVGIENSGRYAWQVPNNVPQRILVRVDAFDLVGNVGTAQAPGPVQLP